MLVILLIVLGVLFFGLCFLPIKHEGVVDIICNIQIIILVIAGFAGLFILFWVTEIPVYNSLIRQISAIEQMNTEMMSEINTSVQDYYNLTTDVYAQIQSGTLFLQYPEIKTEPVENQMKQITQNNKEIKEKTMKKIGLEENLKFYLLYKKGE